MPSGSVSLSDSQSPTLRTRVLCSASKPLSMQSAAGRGLCTVHTEDFGAPAGVWVLGSLIRL